MSRQFSVCVKVISLTVLCCWLQLIVGATPDRARKNDAEIIRNEKGDIAFPDDLHLPKQNFMVHHHHGPDFYQYRNYEFHHHHHHGEDFDAKGPEMDQFEEHDYDNSSMGIPLKYIQDLNQHNVSDLLLHFVEGQDVRDEFISITNRFGDNEGEERSAATMSGGAECMPELRTVQLVSSEDPSILYIPECTRIERCGGCCKNSLLSCQPIKKESIPFKIFKTQYTGDKKLKFLGTEVVTSEKHNKCKCLCRIQPEDCTKFQEYRESECRCVCANHDERKKCGKNNDKKLWNPDLCVCQCRENMQCSTGSYFDQNQCRCVALPRNRRVANFRRNYRSEPLPVVPLDEY